ncbi:unnamed protein product [Lactuca virosa]|uniref:PsbP C-terminal domain-containing protein n=1 Tax=Lactuca virosa TaxID=75947 RepID=A0AAU9MTN6_9ASTR|nr:unnamed protein product [Lactuca virosa]
MISSSCFSLVKINPTTQPTIVNASNSTSPHSPPLSNLQRPTSSNHNNRLPIQPTRRNLLNISILTIIASPISPFLSSTSTWAQTQEYLELESYTDTNEGFTLLRPTPWTKVEKAGATALFEDPSKGGNNIGVVVTPVRLTSLREFGDPQFVANKLIQAEKRKESTKDVEIISSSERGGQKGDDVQVYEFEYKLDSTRGGVKRVFSAAFVASKKLYLLNIAYSDNPEKPLDDHTRMILEQVLHSFHVISPPLVNSQV